MENGQLSKTDIEALERNSSPDLQTIVDKHLPDSPYRIQALRILDQRQYEKEFKQRTEEWHRYLADAARNTAYAYWAAILTSNSIIVAVFATSLFSSIQKDILAQLLVGVSLASSFFIILVFRGALAFQRKAGTRFRQDLTDEERSEDIKQAQQNGRKTKKYEQICEWIFVVQVAIILFRAV